LKKGLHRTLLDGAIGLGHAQTVLKNPHGTVEKSNLYSFCIWQATSFGKLMTHTFGSHAVVESSLTITASAAEEQQRKFR
jgi:hypothetical protein